jgi:Leucine-rich repeat (LRR) protein
MAEFKYKSDDPKAAFAEAEKRIQQALKTGAKKLDLSALYLTELPESVSRLSKLRRLDVHYPSRIKVLPEWIGELSELESLELGGNQAGSLKKFQMSFQFISQRLVLV